MYLIIGLLSASFLLSFSTWMYMKCSDREERTNNKTIVYNIYNVFIYYVLNSLMSFLLWRNVYLIYQHTEEEYKPNVVYISLFYIFIYISMNFKYYISMIYTKTE